MLLLLFLPGPRATAPMAGATVSQRAMVTTMEVASRRGAGPCPCHDAGENHQQPGTDEERRARRDQLRGTNPSLPPVLVPGRRPAGGGGHAQHGERRPQEEQDDDVSDDEDPLDPAAATGTTAGPSGPPRAPDTPDRSPRCSSVLTPATWCALSSAWPPRAAVRYGPKARYRPGLGHELTIVNAERGTRAVQDEREHPAAMTLRPSPGPGRQASGRSGRTCGCGLAVAAARRSGRVSVWAGLWRVAAIQRW